MGTKKAAPKKVAKKQVKKAVKKVVKKAPKKATKTSKKLVKKPAKKVIKKTDPKDVVLQPVKVPGLATVRSVDDPGTASEGQPATVKPYLDPETGVLVMVPDVD